MVPVARGPITLAATSDSIWVKSHRLNIVTRIDPSQNKEVARLKDAPVHCSVFSGGGFVWASEANADSGAGKVTKIDPASGTVVGSIDLNTACGISADDTDLWVTSPMLSQVVRYDAATLEQRAVIPVGKDIFEVKIGPDAVWVSGESGRRNGLADRPCDEPGRGFHQYFGFHTRWTRSRLWLRLGGVARQGRPLPYRSGDEHGRRDDQGERFDRRDRGRSGRNLGFGVWRWDDLQD